MLAILEKGGEFLAVVIPYELGNRYDIRFRITAQQEQALRPYVAGRELVSIPVAIKQDEQRVLLALSMLDTHPVYAENASAVMAYVSPFFDCTHTWTK